MSLAYPYGTKVSLHGKISDTRNTEGIFANTFPFRHQHLLGEDQCGCAGAQLFSIRANDNHWEISAGCTGSKGDAEIFLSVPFHLL